MSGYRLLLASALLLGMVACSDNNNGSSSSSGGTTSGTTTTTSTGSTGGTGSTGSTGGTTGAVTLTIASFSWPSNINVPVGGKIHVVNNDSAPHTVTSETSANAFTPGAVDGVSFDTGNVPAGGTADITLSGGHAGDVIPYYCKIHTSGMTPANPTITLQ